MQTRLNIFNLRDPFLLKEAGVYYMYGTGIDESNPALTEWTCYKNDGDLFSGEWVKLPSSFVKIPEGAVKCFWAPEVHKVNGEFYMLTTYYSEKSGHRGCTVLRSRSPEGPFTEISNGHITPRDWDSIDGTLYFEDGEPWMIFVHEWTSTCDGVGRMAAARLSPDLTRFAGEPIELWRADSPVWATRNITDGCFPYVTESGRLLIIWSNFEQGGYCVGVARAKGERLTDGFTQETELLYSRKIDGKYDGGHGMIFTDTDGKKYLVLHSPNSHREACEQVVLCELFESDGKLSL